MFESRSTVETNQRGFLDGGCLRELVTLESLYPRNLVVHSLVSKALSVCWPVQRSFVDGTKPAANSFSVSQSPIVNVRRCPPAWCPKQRQLPSVSRVRCPVALCSGGREQFGVGSFSVSLLVGSNGKSASLRGGGLVLKKPRTNLKAFCCVVWLSGFAKRIHKTFP